MKQLKNGTVQFNRRQSQRMLIGTAMIMGPVVILGMIAFMSTMGAPKTPLLMLGGFFVLMSVMDFIFWSIFNKPLITMTHSTIKLRMRPEIHKDDISAVVIKKVKPQRGPEREFLVFEIKDLSSYPVRSEYILSNFPDGSPFSVPVEIMEKEDVEFLTQYQWNK